MFSVFENMLQAVVMLTPRMPLYIPCVYNVFMYSATVAGWRAGLPTLVYHSDLKSVL